MWKEQKYVLDYSIVSSQYPKSEIFAYSHRSIILFDHIIRTIGLGAQENENLVCNHLVPHMIESVIENLAGCQKRSGHMELPLINPQIDKAHGALLQLQAPVDPGVFLHLPSPFDLPALSIMLPTIVSEVD